MWAIIKKTLLTLLTLIVTFIAYEYLVLFYATYQTDKAGVCWTLGPSDPYGENFEWHKLRGDNDIEACLVELARNLGAPEKMAAWLEGQGFSDISMSFSDEKDEKTYVNAYWEPHKTGKRFPDYMYPSVFIYLITRNTTYRLSVGYINDFAFEAEGLYLYL